MKTPAFKRTATSFVTTCLPFLFAAGAVLHCGSSGPSGESPGAGDDAGGMTSSGSSGSNGSSEGEADGGPSGLADGSSVSSSESDGSAGNGAIVGAGGPMPVGLYSGWDAVEAYETQMEALKQPIHRLAGPVDDGEWAALLQVGAKVMYTLSGTDVPSTLSDIDTVLGRYGPGGTYWADNPTALNQPIESVEVLNESNFAGISASTYASILIAAYPHVKATWPSVIVVGMSCGDEYAAAGPWMEQVFAANPAVVTSMDVFSLHPYTASTAPDQDLTSQGFGGTLPEHLASLRSIAAAAGMNSNMPWWVTEVGYQINQAEGGSFSAIAPDWFNTLAQQAAYNIRFDIVAMRLNLARVYHMFVNDADMFNGGYFQNSDGSARPVATATQQEIALLNGYTSLDVVREDFGGGNPFVYRFHTPSKTVIVAWAQNVQTVPIAIAGNTTVTDMVGNVLATTTQSSYSAALSENPVFLTSM